MFFCTSYASVSVFLFLLILLVPVSSGSIEDVVPEHLMKNIYQAYKESLNIEEGTVSARRVFTNNKQYEIHIMKLNEVNGNKRHNVMVKESNETNPLIYINNPLETKLPHAYLTYEEFKQALTDRVKILRGQYVTSVKNIATSKATTTEKPKENKIVQNFKKFIDRLIKLQKDEAINQTGKTNENRLSTFKIYTLQTDPEYANITKSGRKTTKSTTAKQNNILRSKAKNTVLRTGVTEDVTDPTAIESAVTKRKVTKDEVEKTGAFATKEPTKPKVSPGGVAKVTEQFTVELSTRYIENTSDILEGTTTKWTSPGKPLVWMEGEENPMGTENY